MKYYILGKLSGTMKLVSDKIPHSETFWFKIWKEPNLANESIEDTCQRTQVRSMLKRPQNEFTTSWCFGGAANLARDALQD